MKQIVFTVYDVKAKLHLQPFFMRSIPEAVRAFGDLANDEGHQFGKHPEDYTLVQIGDYDETSGLIDPLKEPVVLVRAEQLLVQEKGAHLKGNGAENYQVDVEEAIRAEAYKQEN